jgi:hypothetical protein
MPAINMTERQNPEKLVEDAESFHEEQVNSFFREGEL